MITAKIFPQHMSTPQHNKKSLSEYVLVFKPNIVNEKSYAKHWYNPLT